MLLHRMHELADRGSAAGAMLAHDAGTSSLANSAPTAVVPVIATLHGPLPVHAPVQRPNRDLPIACALRALPATSTANAWSGGGAKGAGGGVG
jgi:hypothetical protein